MGIKWWLECDPDDLPAYIAWGYYTKAIQGVAPKSVSLQSVLDYINREILCDVAQKALEILKTNATGESNGK